MVGLPQPRNVHPSVRRGRRVQEVGVVCHGLDAAVAWQQGRCALHPCWPQIQGMRMHA
jgi:hypothetical protein